MHRHDPDDVFLVAQGLGRPAVVGGAGALGVGQEVRDTRASLRLFGQQAQVGLAGGPVLRRPGPHVDARLVRQLADQVLRPHDAGEHPPVGQLVQGGPGLGPKRALLLGQLRKHLVEGQAGLVVHQPGPGQFLIGKTEGRAAQDGQQGKVLEGVVQDLQ